MSGSTGTHAKSRRGPERTTPAAIWKIGSSAGALLYEGAGRLAGGRVDARAEVAADLLEGVAHGLGDAAVVGEGELGGIGMPDTGVALVGAVRRDGGKHLDPQ